jgi:hypothetical protein
MAPALLGKFKVAMHTYNPGCYHRGYEYYCCEPSCYTETTRCSSSSSSSVAAFQDAVAQRGADQTCSTTDGMSTYNPSWDSDI